MATRPRLRVSCPSSALSWTATPRAVAGDPDRRAIVCPSCGRRLELRWTVGGLELLAPYQAGGAGPHLVTSG